jgi:O-antigen ligase
VVIGRTHEAIPGLGGLPLATPAVALAGLALIWYGYLRRLSIVTKQPQMRWLLLLLVLATISVPFALWQGGAVSALMALARLVVFGLLVSIAIVNVRQLQVVTRTFAVATAVLATGYILQSFAGMADFTSRQTLSFDRNDVAMFCAMGVPFALEWAASGKRLVGYGIAGYLALGVIATASRGGFLALGVLGLVFLWRSRLLSKLKKTALVVGVLFLGGIAGSGEYWDRIGSIFSSPTEDYNFQIREGRIEIWKRGAMYTVAHPLTGLGIGNFWIAEGEYLKDEGYGVKWSTAHNSYVLAAAELGLPAFIVFLALLTSIWREARRSALLASRARPPPDATALVRLGDAIGLSLVGYLVASMFLSATYSVSLVFLVSVSASLGLIRRSRHARS